MSDNSDNSNEMTTYDVVVVGGGAAGLSGALALGRARRSVLVVDAGDPRNAPAGHVHNYLGREGTPPGELLAIGRSEVESYGGRVVAGRVSAARAWDEDRVGFVVTLDDGREVSARRLLVTTGLVDELPDLPGLQERWGTDVLHCPYCHGWEVRDQALGVIASNGFATHQALMFRQWSSDITLFLDGRPAPDADQAEQLAARGIEVVTGPIEEVVVEDDRIAGVRLVSGEVVARQALVVSPRFTARSEVLASLGIDAVEQEMFGEVVGSAVPADPTGATSVPGVWVAGNVTDLRAQVVSSAAAGLNAGAMVNMDLITEDTAIDVEHHRTILSFFEEEPWDERYFSSPAIWSGNPNPQLVAEVADLTPGRALDIGSGEGADVIWLAERGWQVTGLDFSQVALDRAAAHADAAGVGDRTAWEHADLRGWSPSTTYDLVTSQFMHQPDGGMTRIVATLADAVAPGGTLLVVGHHPVDHATGLRSHAPTFMFAAEDLVPALDPEVWKIEVVETRTREVVGHEGEPVTARDAVLRAVRH